MKFDAITRRLQPLCEGGETSEVFVFRCGGERCVFCYVFCSVLRLSMVFFLEFLWIFGFFSRFFWRFLGFLCELQVLCCIVGLTFTSKPTAKTTETGHLTVFFGMNTGPRFNRKLFGMNKSVEVSTCFSGCTGVAGARLGCKLRGSSACDTEGPRLGKTFQRDKAIGFFTFSASKSCGF